MSAAARVGGVVKVAGGSTVQLIDRAAPRGWWAIARDGTLARLVLVGGKWQVVEVRPRAGQ